MKKKIERAIKEYIERAIRYHTSNNSCSTDIYVDCPKCDKMRSVVYEHNEWRCLYRCEFTFPENFVPPSQKQIKEFLDERKKKAEFARTSRLIKQLNIDINAIKKRAVQKNKKQQKFYDSVRHII